MEKRKGDAIAPQVLTTQEVAQYLRLTEATIYKLAKSGEIPAARVGRAWRFRKDLIDEWFKNKSLDAKSEHLYQE